MSVLRDGLTAEVVALRLSAAQYLLEVDPKQEKFTLDALTPGLKLTPVLAAVPVSGLSLILQNLLAVSGEPVSALSWVLGVGSLMACVVFALSWASWQFRREAVLFRGEEGPSLKAWWRILTERE